MKKDTGMPDNIVLNVYSLEVRRILKEKIRLKIQPNNIVIKEIWQIFTVRLFIKVSGKIILNKKRSIQNKGKYSINFSPLSILN